MCQKEQSRMCVRKSRVGCVSERAELDVCQKEQSRMCVRKSRVGCVSERAE